MPKPVGLLGHTKKMNVKPVKVQDWITLPLECMDEFPFVRKSIALVVV